MKKSSEQTARFELTSSISKELPFLSNLLIHIRRILDVAHDALVP